MTPDEQRHVEAVRQALARIASAARRDDVTVGVLRGDVEALRLAFDSLFPAA